MNITIAAATAIVKQTDRNLWLNMVAQLLLPKIGQNPYFIDFT